MKTILLIVTGSIAAFKSAALASKLTQAGYRVKVVMSKSAAEFIGPITFEGLTGEVPLLSTFESGHAMAHIHLAREADLVLVYPASANTVTKFARGEASDLVGTLFLAMDLRPDAKAPIWIAPAMNPTMYAHPAVQAATKTLIGYGCKVLEPTTGSMACGEIGQGRLVEPEDMLTRIQTYFAGAKAPLARETILVTAGGTSEPVDSVRVLSNTSTGETGVRLANQLAQDGANVTLLLARSSPHLPQVANGVTTLSFETSNELDSLLKRELQKGTTTTLIHAAAVSDYSVAKIETASGGELSSAQKISGEGELKLTLAPAPKLLSKVRAYAPNSSLKIISFKLSTDENSDLSHYPSDAIVANLVSGIERGTDRHAGKLFVRAGDAFKSQTTFQTKTEMADSVSNWIQNAQETNV